MLSTGLTPKPIHNPRGDLHPWNHLSNALLRLPSTGRTGRIVFPIRHTDATVVNIWITVSISSTLIPGYMLFFFHISPLLNYLKRQQWKSKRKCPFCHPCITPGVPDISPLKIIGKLTFLKVERLRDIPGSSPLTVCVFDLDDPQAVFSRHQ